MRERIALLALLLCFLAALKWTFNPGLGRNSLDGDYYYQIARNVAEGKGFRTNVSLYHQGLEELPAPTSIYPLWPLLLGWSGRWAGLPLAAALLPELLYLAGLALLWLLAVRLQESFGGRPSPFLLRDGKVIDAGHAAVLLLGLNPVFFYFTSLPYTEALAWLLLLGALLAAVRASKGGAPAAAAAGALAGASYLARSQMLLAILALLASFLLAGLKERRFLRSAALAAGGAALVVGPWILYLLTFVRPFDPWVLIYFQRFRQTPEIAHFVGGVPTGSLWEFLADRAPGLVVAFNPWEPFSYVASFGLAAWLAPLALFHLATHHRELRRGLGALLSSRALPLTATLLTGLLMVAPLQLNHSRFLWEWRFHHRHGLPLLLVLLVALGYLLARGGRPVRAAALTLLALGVAWGCFKTVGRIDDRLASGVLGAEPELVEWLDAHPEPPLVLTTNPQTLSVFSRAHYHWTECRESAAKTFQYVDLLEVDYVLVYAGEEECPFAAGLEERLERVRGFGAAGLRIEVWADPARAGRRSTSPAAPRAAD